MSASRRLLLLACLAVDLATVASVAWGVCHHSRWATLLAVALGLPAALVGMAAALPVVIRGQASR